MGGHLMASGAIAPHSTSKGVGDGVPHQFKYDAGDTDARVVTFTDKDALCKGLAKVVARQYEAAVKKHGLFTLVLSGGSLTGMLPAIMDNASSYDFNKWHVFWADERNVEHSHPDSNYGDAKKKFLDLTSIPDENIHKIQEKLPVEQAATAYEGKLLSLKDKVLPTSSKGYPIFDLILLGIGPDAHTCSLFPNFPQVQQDTPKWVLPVDNSPKPPPERITLTLPVLNAGSCVAFVVAGGSKSETLHRILEVQSLPGAVPAQMVRPGEGVLYWLLDSEAAKDLESIDWDDPKAYPRNDF